MLHLRIKIIAIAALALGFAATPAIAQSPVNSPNGRSYNLRTVDNSSGTWTGATTTFNNGTSNLSVPTPTGSSIVDPAQASFNMWVYMTPLGQPDCYAEIALLKRRYKNNSQPGFDGRVFAHTTYDAQGVKRQKQTPVGTSGDSTQGGFVGTITIGSGGNLQFSGGATLTVPNFQCRRSGAQGVVYVNPTGFSMVDRGFEGNTTASVWTSGASMGKTQERVGSGNYQTSPNHYVPSGLPTYSTWGSSYNPNDNQGTIILFR